MAEDNSRIQTIPIEDVFGERFGRYSKYIIQERALPDIRDGLKPVQRRILYSMDRDGNTYDKAYRKSAKSVGNVMGNFHPHGDSSIYDAMIRMSQDWKMGETLIEMHGNNGSMDGDSPAAMRYTEARLSKISEYLLKDIEKETVATAWNFDDTEKEPTVLPASFPNLLVNGSTGISAGYATDIPPHNLGEVIDATIYMIDHPGATVEQLMSLLPGPDFPTGGIIQGREGIVQAYETGKGKIVLRAKSHMETLKGGREQIVFTEIPYELNKANLVKKMAEIGDANKVPGIDEVRDESDREGLRIAVDLKKDADSTLVLNYLLKNTDLQVNYNFNMVAIDHMTPQQVGIVKVLSSYIEFRRDVIIARSQFDLDKAKKRLHIVEGLIRMVSILDEVVATIRASENKADAKENLKVSFDFSEEQAEAIVTLQLYRLTNTDIVVLQNEKTELDEKILELQAVINDDKTLYNLMKRELREVKKDFATPRKSELQDTVETIEIEVADLVVEEETIVSVTRAGYIKRTSLRSYGASEHDEVGKREDDVLVFFGQGKTTQHLLMFTNLGNVIYRPVHELPEIRWKDVGEHISQSLTNFAGDEEVISALLLDAIETDSRKLLVTTKLGQIKQVEVNQFAPWRTYKSKSTAYGKLKGDDHVLQALVVTDAAEIMLISKVGYALRFKLEEVPVLGRTAAGVKAMNLKSDEIASVVQLSSDSLYLLTQKGNIKRFKTDDIPVTSRAGRGIQVLKTQKSDIHTVFAAGNVLAELSENVEPVKDYDETDLFSTEPVATPVSADESTTGLPQADQPKLQMLQVITADGKSYETILSDLTLFDRTSLGEGLGVKAAVVWAEEIEK
ncbi:MAG: DNA topoisomerase IV subunit A [Streptococcaceae bacterium]|jgi:topoisomerase-4 subunit A|nr:DNA topoisomerase IV subunit A [Streptococcaceae bacterium]